MRKIIIIAFLFSFSSISVAQKLFRWEFGAGLGAANYLGEMGGNEKPRRDFILDLKFSQTRWVVNGFARYKLYPSVSIKAELVYARIQGADNLSTNPGRVGRNLSFTNDLIELNVTGEFFFYEINDLGRSYRYRNDFRCYAFAGAGGLYSNPKTEYNGSVVKLQPLHTEGVKYSRFQFVVPTGIGFYFTMSKVHRITYELGYRTTFTDYLDDVSTVYADPSTLGGNPVAIAVANRNPELIYNPDVDNIPPKENYVPGQKRGDPTHNDSYMFTTVSYSYALRGKSRFSKSKKYGSYFKGKRYKKRTIRAKF